MTLQTGNPLLANAANNYLYANESFLIGELLKLGVDSIATAPPGVPADYDSRLIQGTGTGDFASHNNNLALYYDGSWLFAAPVTNMLIWVKSLNCHYIYTGSVWQPAEAWITMTDAVNIVVNAALGRNFQVTLGSNRTLSNPTNITGTGLNNDGKLFTFRIVQDGTGNRTLAFGTKYKFPGGTATVVSTAAGAIDVLIFRYHQATDSMLYVGAYLNQS